MNTLHIDLETYSDVAITNGVYAYSASPAFTVLLFGYAFNDDEPQTIDLTQGETIPENIVEAIASSDTIKIAHNAAFERTCLSRHLGVHLEPESWRDTMIMGLELGLPASLDQLGKVLKIERAKMKEGKALIKLFCVPNKDGDRVMPDSHPEKWEVFKQYNVRDVEAEMDIYSKLSKLPVVQSEWENWFVDQRINDRGVKIDLRLAASAASLGYCIKVRSLNRIKELTGLDNPNSVSQLKRWVNEQGITTDKLDKAVIKDILGTTQNEKVREVLHLRSVIGKSSVTKYQTMLDCHVDSVAHGLIQFYGAPRTGRFAGRLVQVQNLPQNHLEELDEARNLVKSGDLDTLDLLYDNPTQVLSELIRTAFIPQKSDVFSIADYSAIECRVLAWLSGEQWVLDAFTDGKDIYCETASMMFRVPVVKHGVNGELRQKGKIATLACGYGGGKGALAAFGADKIMSDSEMQSVVDMWRNANSHSVKFWWDVDKAAKQAITNGVTSKVGIRKNISIGMLKGFMFVELPSGRRLFYPKPKLDTNKFGGESISYEGLVQNAWCRIESYGPKLVENIVQAVSRDLLVNGLMKAERSGLRPVMHVHDEIIADTEDLEALKKCMEDSPIWADGLPLRADGYTSKYYKKD